MRRNPIPVVLLLLAGIALPALEVAADGYRLRPIIQDFGGRTEIHDLNDWGEVVGIQYGEQETIPFRWRNGKLKRLDKPSLGGRTEWIVPLAINEWSAIAGIRSVDQQTEGFLLHGRRVWPLSIHADRRVQPEGLNNLGQVVARRIGDWEAGSFLLTPQGPLQLGTVEGATSMMHAIRINDRGVVAGNVLWGHGARPVVWRKGKITALQIPPDIDVDTCFANDLNNRSQVVGRITTGYGSRAFRSEGDAIQLLRMRTTWPQESNEARGINDWGAIVGDSSILFSPHESGSTATIWFGDAVHDLNDLIDQHDPLKPHVRLDVALRVNNRGDIIARGYDSRVPEGVAYYLLTLFAPHGP